MLSKRRRSVTMVMVAMMASIIAINCGIAIIRFISFSIGGVMCTWFVFVGFGVAIQIESNRFGVRWRFWLTNGSSS